MSAYPSPFDHATFPVVPDAVAEKKRVSDKLVAKAPIQVQGALRIGDAPDAAITALWLESAPSDGERSQSFQNLAPGTNAPIDASSHYAYLPGVDAMNACWTVTSAGAATKAKLELFSALKSGAVWTREYTGGEAVTLLSGPGSDGSGTFDLGTVSITGDPDFLANVPNVHGAPYQLRLTITGSRGKVTTAWTYFDVLVHSLELHWGPDTLIPGGDIADVLPIYQALTRRDEPALLNALSATATRIDPDAAVELPLKSTNAAYLDLQEWYTWRDFSFLRFKGRWGKGPRLPVLVTVAMKSRGGDDGVTTPLALQALGPAEFLWDWRDKARRPIEESKIRRMQAPGRSSWRRSSTRRTPPASRPTASTRTRIAAASGGALTVSSPPSAIPRFFPSASPLRRLARGGPSAKRRPRGRTREADRHPSPGHSRRPASEQLPAPLFLASGRKAALDVGGAMDDLVTANQDLPTTKTGMMEVRRRIDARYIRKGTSTGRIDLDAVSQEYAKGGIKLVWTEPTWAKVDFDTYFNEALNPDNTGEATTYTRNRVFQKTARARRSAMSDWKVYKGGSSTKVDSPVKAALGAYDQWFGCKAGATRVGASAANFTVPNRDLVEAPYISTVVAAYISKNRKINDKLRKWNRLKTQNPTVADPQLRVTFFNTVLTAAERLKLLPEIKRLYEDDGWAGWDVPRDNVLKWANKNYNYKSSKLLYVSVEMHLRKVLADTAFEGVTLFHYQDFYEVLDATGAVESRQCEIGGVAAVEINADLGLSGAFLVWDHPSNGQRQALARQLCEQAGTTPQGVDHHTGPNHGSCTFQNGNHTVVHEFGHFLHLPHAAPTGGEHEAAVHDSNDAKCILNYDPDALHLCGGCLLRLRGWAYFQSKGMRGFNRTNPTSAGPVPPAPSKAGLETEFNGFYTDYV